jgi:hypothetical protein
MFETKQTDKQSSNNVLSATKHIPLNNRTEIKQPNSLPGARHFLQRNLGNSLMQSIAHAGGRGESSLSETKRTSFHSKPLSCCPTKS